MGQEQFAALMPIITESLASRIVQEQKLSETDAIIALYNSKLYALLEDENTKLWQYSTEMLYRLFEEEQKTGSISFPDV